jgi:peptidoglycan/LPS O-acetylase OafA/YrhL
MRLTTVELARFAAATSVVLYHFGGKLGPLAKVTRFGYLGVPLFFIISGYVISLSAGNKSANAFAVSRFVRLYPTYWAAITFTVLVTAMCGKYIYTPAQILANLTMLNDYFKVPNVDGVYWTLQVELKFYGCTFVLLALGAFDKFRIWLSAWLTLTLLYLLTNQPFFMGWFINPYYSSFFIAGVAFYFIHTRGMSKFNLFILLSSLALSSIRAYEQTSEFQPHPGAFEGFVAVAAVWLFYGFFYLVVTGRLTLSNRRSYVFLGALTYPLYLIHNMAGKAIIDNSFTFLPEEARVALTILLMLFCASLIHILVEKRISVAIKREMLKTPGVAGSA